MTFDINQFKKSVKQWLLDNPQGQLEDLADYCESLIPTPLYPSHQWLVDQTLGWFHHVQSLRSDPNNGNDLA